MKSRLKRYDRDLHHIIKASKYDKPDDYDKTRKRSKTTNLNKTEGNEETHVPSLSINHINNTMYDKEDKEEDNLTTKNSLQACFFDYDLSCIKKPV